MLLIFIGQANVERGFSKNTAMMITSLSDISTVSKKLLKDHMHANNNKPPEVNVNSKMIS